MGEHHIAGSGEAGEQLAHGGKLGLAPALSAGSGSSAGSASATPSPKAKRAVLEAAAVAAGEHPLDRRRPGSEQGAHLAGLQLAAVGEVALRGAIADVELGRVGSARRQRMADQHHSAAFPQERPAGLGGRCRRSKQDKQRRARQPEMPKRKISIPPLYRR